MIESYVVQDIASNYAANLAILSHMSTDPTIFDRIAELRVVPVIAIDDVNAALPLADALIAGGLPIAEITFRTDVAADVISRLRTERPQLLVGAGTVLTADNLQAANDSRAQFCVAPGLNPEIVRLAQQLDVPFAPGVATPSEVEQAMALGVTTLKFFPAGALGGVPTLKAIAAPYRHTGVRFMPTGGVDAINAAKYLALDSVIAVGGTWIAKPEDLAGGRWNEIRQRCDAVAKHDNV